MKLIRCKNCNDVVRLVHTRWRMCDCGQSGGQYNEDLITATVGGSCEIFGISNLFFDEEFNKLSEDEKVSYRKEINHHWCEIWFGEGVGDVQIHRIKSSKGPRLKMEVEWVGKNLTKSTFLDKRNYSINLNDDKKPKYIITGNEMKPSFLDKEHRLELHSSEINGRSIEEYEFWFKKKFECLPFEKHHGVGPTNIEEALSLRRDFPNDSKYSVITFEEYKKFSKQN